MVAKRNICLQSRLRTSHDLHIKDSKSSFMHLHKMFYLFFVKQQQQQLNMWNMRVERFLLNRKIKFARRGSRRCNSKYDWIFHGRSIYYRSKIDSQIRLVTVKRTPLYYCCPCGKNIIHTLYTLLVHTAFLNY